MVIRFCLLLFLVMQFVVQLVAQTKSTTSDIFSGTVTASQADSITVVRKVTGRADESRVFAIDKDTKVEGRLKANARVTVRFGADSGGKARALRIIVRVDMKPSPGRGTKRVR